MPTLQGDRALLAESEKALSTIQIPNTTIRHNGVAEYSAVGVNIPINIGQIGLDKNSIGQGNVFYSGSSQSGSSEINAVESTFHDNSIIQIGSVENSSQNKGFGERGSAQVSINKNPTTNFTTQSSPTQISLNQLDLTKISFSPSVESKQFFSVHNSTPEITNVLNNTATNVWSDLLQTETQLDIDFRITDLPSGQLAEATITDFDDSGVPNAGTILIDHDANGVGWFIDSTPLDNSEFTAQNTDSYLLATAKSEAS